MIIKQPFEVLTNAVGTDKCDMKTLLQESKNLSALWENHIVDNTKQTNFSIDENMKLCYRSTAGEYRENDISEFAFYQLCSRIGIPGNYIRKCFQSGKPDLAISNIREWAKDSDKNLMVREHNGTARAILSDSFVPFDSHKILKSLYNTVDDQVYQPSQVLLSEDRLHIRFVNHEPLAVDDKTPLYSGFTVDSSDVGRGSLSMCFFIYRFACRNGCVLSDMGGTLFRQSHIGDKMSMGKIELFARSLLNVDVLAEQSLQLIAENQGKHLKDYELQTYLGKAAKELNMSDKGQKKLLEIMDSTYDRSLWGLVNGMTEVAQEYSLDSRIAYESWAGNLLTNAAR